MSTYVERTRAQLHGALLDALYDTIVAGHSNTISMARIAARVGVSRQTLYNEFGSKDALIAALAARENAVLLTMVTATLEQHPHDLAAGVAAAVDMALRRAADDPLHKALLSGEAGLLPFFMTRAEPLLERSRATLNAYALAHYPELDPGDAEVLVDVVVRLTHSHLLLPKESPEVVASRIGRLVDRFTRGGHR